MEPSRRFAVGWVFAPGQQGNVQILAALYMCTREGISTLLSYSASGTRLTLFEKLKKSGGGRGAIAHRRIEEGRKMGALLFWLLVRGDSTFTEIYLGILHPRARPQRATEVHTASHRRSRHRGGPLPKLESSIGPQSEQASRKDLPHSL